MGSSQVEGIHRADTGPLSFLRAKSRDSLQVVRHYGTGEIALIEIVLLPLPVEEGLGTHLKTNERAA